MKMKYKDGKSKVLTLSYDDGVVQDIRFIKILDKYGIKATFNINTGKYLQEDAKREKFFGPMKLSEAKGLYINSGHEVAIHTLTHPRLEWLEPEQIMSEVSEDRKNIEQQYGVRPRGMAYPYGTYDNKVIKTLEKCDVCYCRTIQSTESFEIPQNWLTLHPTCHHNNPKLMEIAKKFLDDDGFCKLFYVWGHTYEFDRDDNWNVIEEFAEFLGNRPDVWYATNIEVYDYVKAYESLKVDKNNATVFNPSDIDVWFEENENTYCVKGGETVSIM